MRRSLRAGTRKGVSPFVKTYSERRTDRTKCGVYLLASSLAAALLEGLFAHPAWLFSVVSTLDICDGYRGQNEFFRSLLVRGESIKRTLLIPKHPNEQYMDRLFRRGTVPVRA